MKTNRCEFCNNFIETTYRITEIKQKKSASIFDLCEKCGQNYIQNISEKFHNNLEKETENTHIETPDKILHFRNGILIFSQKNNISCTCGMTVEVFKSQRRMGCPNCYDYFGEKINRMLLAIHGSDKHVGRLPTTEPDWDNIEDSKVKMKLLKFHYSRALELEEYEKLAGLKSRIDQLNKC